MLCENPDRQCKDPVCKNCGTMHKNKLLCFECNVFVKAAEGKSTNPGTKIKVLE